jgi:hypothetical protein
MKLIFEILCSMNAYMKTNNEYCILKFFFINYRSKSKNINKMFSEIPKDLNFRYESSAASLLDSNNNFPLNLDMCIKYE